MTFLPGMIHFFIIAASTVFAALGVSIGQGFTSKASFNAINRQPAAQPDITRTTLLALALIETSAILGLLISFLLFFKVPTNQWGVIAELGMGIAISLPGLFIGLASSMPAYEALGAIARQPFLARKLSNFMLLSQSLIQTPLIFGFIVALIIRTKIPHVTNAAQALALIGSGLAIGIGCVGPALGGGLFTKTACQSAGINRHAYPKLFTFTFISQAIIETPVIFASIISFFLTTKALSLPDNPLLGFCYLAFALTIGFGTFGAGISSGRSAAAAAHQIAYNPQAYNLLARSSMMAQGLIDTCAVYAFIIALWLILMPLTSFF